VTLRRLKKAKRTADSAPAETYCSRSVIHWLKEQKEGEEKITCDSDHGTRNDPPKGATRI